MILICIKQAIIQIRLTKLVIELDFKAGMASFQGYFFIKLSKIIVLARNRRQNKLQPRCHKEIYF